jgi:hypothetical protein
MMEEVRRSGSTRQLDTGESVTLRKAQRNYSFDLVPQMGDKIK